MLRGIHNATRNWLGRTVTGIILGLIAISFAVWGIGDVFKGFGQSTVATIGRTEISVAQFRQLFIERQQQLARQLGRTLSADQVRALGLPQQMLGQLLAEAALDEDARNLKLSISDATVVSFIHNDPSFRGVNGQFDTNRFHGLIRQAGFTEQRFIAEQRRTLLRRQILDSLTANLPVPETALRMQNHFLNEQRALQYVLIDAQQIGKIDAPAPDVLAKFFEERQAAFRAPEYRKIEFVLLTPAEIAARIEVSDADVKKAYDERRASFAVPERRDLQQIIFPNADEAKAAAEKLARGMSFAELAAERKISAKDLNLGLLAKTAIFDQAIAEAAFALPQGGVSAPVEGRFGWALVRVAKIEPGSEKPLSEMAAQLKRDIALERARHELTSLRDKLEDERGAGALLGEIAGKLGLPTRIVAATDRAGRNPDGQPVEGLPQDVDLLAQAFATEIGVESDALTVPGGGYLWYEVLDVTPSRERNLDEIKDRVIERWQQEQAATRVREKAVALADKLKAGGDDKAALGNLAWQTTFGLKRNQTTGHVPQRALGEIFALPKGGVSSSEGDNPGQWVVFRVTEITAPSLDQQSAETKQMQDKLRLAYADDLIAQYIGRLQTELRTTINEAALNSAIGFAPN